jgi:hypothetical protein
MSVLPLPKGQGSLTVTLSSVTPHRIDVRDQPLDSVPTLGEVDDPILAPGDHDDMGPGWTLYYLHLSGEVQAFHIPRKVVPDVAAAEALARGHLARNGGGQGWLDRT